MALSIPETLPSPVWTQKEPYVHRPSRPSLLQRLSDEKQSRGNPARRTAITRKYRDVAYIRKDIISKLLAYGELSQNRLMSYCGLNAVKHRLIVQQLINCGLITMREEFQGNKRLLVYGCSEKGMRFCQQILDPYEDLFPREEQAPKESTCRNKPPNGPKMHSSLAENLVRLQS